MYWDGSSDPAFSTLCDIISDNELIIVSGAGVSLTLKSKANPSEGLPNWKQLLERLRNNNLVALTGETLLDVNALLDGADVSPEYLIEAAEILRESLGNESFRNAVVMATTPQDREFSEIHRRLLKLQPRGIITFNYDQGHENATHSSGVVRATYADSKKLCDLISGGFKQDFILKAHGCVSKPETIVLDRASYRRILTEHRTYRAFFEHTLTRFNALIVGFGMKDPDFDDLIRTLELTYGGKVRDHIYVYKRTGGAGEAAAEVALRRRYGLIPIPLQDYGQLPCMLDRASTHLGPRLRSIVDDAVKLKSDGTKDALETRRLAHQRIQQLNNIGSQLVAQHFLEIANNEREDPDKRAEAVYALGRIAPMSESTATFLVELLSRRPQPEIGVHCLVALEQYSPDNLELWIGKANKLGEVCKAIDGDILAARDRGNARACHYLTALIAQWEATMAAR